MTVMLCDVGPRDGLQNESANLPPAARAELVERLAACGLRRIEAASFVSPARVPQMADAEEVVQRVERSPGVSYAGLVLNERGYERLRATTLDEVRLAVACTDGFSEQNTNRPVAEAMRDAEAIARAAARDGRRVSITLTVAFGCPFGGLVDEAAVLKLAERLLGAGPSELILADTIGVASPRHVGRLVRALAGTGPTVGVHLHDTRNTAVACAIAALENGATVLDGSVGGIGGCPFAPGATGNVATEDLVYVLERDGIPTGVDLDALIDVAHWVADLLGHPLPGHLQRVGPPRTARSAGSPSAVTSSRSQRREAS